MTKLAQHSKESVRWGTPKAIVDIAKSVFDVAQFCLDPGSEPEFNLIVGAKKIFTEADNGLEQDWGPYRNIFVNPPGGLVKEFWEKSVETFRNNNTIAIFWVGFSLNQLATLQDCTKNPLDYYTLILRNRLKFVRPADQSCDALGEMKKDAPSHNNYITLIYEPSVRHLYGDYLSQYGVWT